MTKPKISPQEAVMRLLALWCHRTIDDKHYSLRVRLGDVLTWDHVRAILADPSLLAEFSHEQREQMLKQRTDWEGYRGRRLVDAWLSKNGGLQ